MQDNIGAQIFRRGCYNEQIQKQLQIERERNNARVGQEKYDKKVNEGVELLETYIDDIKNDRRIDKCHQQFICGRLRYIVYDVRVPYGSIKSINKKYRKSNIVVSDRYYSDENKWFLRFDFYDDSVKL